MLRFLRWTTLSMLVLGLVACGGGGSPTHENAPPTATPSPTATATPTPIATSTPTPAPTSDPMAAGPAIFWISQPVHPDETLLASTGNSPASDPGLKVSLGQLSDADPGSPLQQGEAYTLQRAHSLLSPKSVTDRSLMLTVPPNWTSGIYELRLSTSQGDTTSLVNLPEPWFVQGDQGESATPGGFFIVAGTCLDLSGAYAPQAALVQKGVLVQKLSLSERMTTSAGYALKFAVPSNLAEGDYEIHVHNGKGGPKAWVKYATFIESPVETVAIRAAVPWPNTQVSVADQSGANDDERFAKAISALTASGGGRLFVPAGIYTLTQSLILPNRTLLVGAGRTKTRLQWTAVPPIPQGETAESTPLIRGANEPGYISKRYTFAIEDLTLEALSDFSGMFIDRKGTQDLGWLKRVGTLSSRVKTVKSVYLRQTSNFLMDEVFFDTANGIWIYNAVNYVSLTRSTLNWRRRSISMGGRSHNYVIHENTFNMRGNITENEWLPADEPGLWFTTFNGLQYMHGPYTRDTLWSKNSSKRDQTNFVLPYYVGYTADGADGIYLGKLRSVDGTTLHLDGITYPRVDYQGNPVGYEYVGSIAQILDGKGAGQWRFVTQASRGASEVKIDRPWTIMPDATSTLSIVNLQGRFLQVDNDFAQEPKLQDYYSSLDTIRVGNTLGAEGAAFGMSAWTGLHYHGTHPSWHMQVMNNHISRGISSIFSSAVISPTPGYSGIVGAAHIYRNNTNSSGGPFTIRFQTNDGPMADVLVENNQATEIRMKNKANETMHYSGVFLRKNATAAGTSSTVSPSGVPGVVVEP